MTDGISLRSAFRVVSTYVYDGQPVTCVDQPMTKTDAMALFEEKAHRPGFAPQTRHGCLWCKDPDCTRRFDHEPLWLGQDTAIRMPLPERLACPNCGQRADNGLPCEPVAELAGVA